MAFSTISTNAFSLLTRISQQSVSVFAKLIYQREANCTWYPQANTTKAIFIAWPISTYNYSTVARRTLFINSLVMSKSILIRILFSLMLELALPRWERSHYSTRLI